MIQAILNKLFRRNTEKRKIDIVMERRIAGARRQLEAIVGMEAEHYRQEADRLRPIHDWFCRTIQHEITATFERNKKPACIITKYFIGGDKDTIVTFGDIPIIHDPNAKELLSVKSEDDEK